MAVQLKQRMTAAEFDEFALLPENADRLFEFMGGEVCEVVSNPYSSSIAIRISTFLGMYLLKNDLGHLTGADGGYEIGNERYIPDVAFISYARQPQLSYQDGYNPNSPDLVVEVLSPSNEAVEMRIKIANYMSVGAVVWIVDPEAQTVEVYTPGQLPQIVRFEDTLDGGKILPGFVLAVQDIFPPEETEE